MEALQGAGIWGNDCGVIIAQRFFSVLENLLMWMMQIHFLLRLIVAITRYKIAARH